MSTKLLRAEQDIQLYELRSDAGIVVQILNYGARIHKLLVLDKNGDYRDIVAGFDNLADYKGDNPYFNAVIGRVANRIGSAHFVLNGKDYRLFANDGPNHLHGGKVGFDKKLWQAEIPSADESRLILKYFSKNGEEGYPGSLEVSVEYSLVNNNELSIKYSATTDSETYCNLTNHAYFNLDGTFESIHDHIITINSSSLTDVDDSLIPTGVIFDVTGTPYDFRRPKRVGEDIGSESPLMKKAGGYDFNYILEPNESKIAASAYSPKSGILMTVYTDAPCLQFYSGNFLDGVEGKKLYKKQSAFCMETQSYPNACNIESFPTNKLRKGERYFTETKYVFSVK